MVILNSRQMIYIHTHKTGGTSVECALDPVCMWNDIILGGTKFGELVQDMYWLKFGLRKHSTATEVRAVVGAEVWDSYSTWATVRHPYERVVSAFNFAATLCEPLLEAANYPINGSAFDQRKWVTSDDYPCGGSWDYPLVKAYLTSRGERRPFSTFIRSESLINDEPAYRPQFESLCDPSQQGLIVKAIVPLEQLSAKWQSLCVELGLPQTDVFIKNESDIRWKKSPSKLLTQRDDIDFINSRFANDFDFLGYLPY